MRFVSFPSSAWLVCYNACPLSPSLTSNAKQSLADRHSQVKLGNERMKLGNERNIRDILYEVLQEIQKGKIL